MATPTIPGSTANEEIGAYFLREYAARQWKDDLFRGLKREAVGALATIIAWVSVASQTEIDEARSEPSFRAALGLARQSFADGSISAELRALAGQSRQRFLLGLGRQRRDLERLAMGPLNAHIRKLARRSAAQALDIRRRILVRALALPKNHVLAAQHREISECIERAPHFLRSLLNDDALRLRLEDGDLAEHLAYCVLHPENSFTELQRLDPAWPSFPLKWHSYQLPVDEGRLLFRAHARGEDLSNYFVTRYDRGATSAFGAIKGLGGLPLLRTRLDSVLEAARAYDAGMYRAAICLSLTIAEGLVWDFAHELHRKHGDVSPKPSEASKVRQLLASARVRDELDGQFIEYFCEELYPERNPILHGRIPDTGNKLQAARKLATVEYLLNRLEPWLADDLLGRFSDTSDGFKAHLDQILAEHKQGNLAASHEAPEGTTFPTVVRLQK